MERLCEICKCLKTLVDFLLCHCDSLPKHDPKPWDPPFDLSQPKLDPPLAVAVTVTVFLFVVTALSSHYYHAVIHRFRRIGANPRSSTISGQITAMSLEKCLVEDGGVLRSQKRDIWTLQEFLGGYKEGKAYGGEIITALFTVILSSVRLNQAAINFYSFEQGRIAAYKLFEMISCSNSSLNQDGSTLATMQGNIEFRNVYFSYLSRPKILILSGFYQNVPARKIVALVGRNDSRKSSIIPLMERFYDLTLDIKHLKLEWLRSQIGLVTQEPTFLSLSIKDNIAYGRSATSDQIEEAAKTIHAHDFITSLEMGYETQVGRTGLTLTEEQKIKISIARVVLSNPSILLLDEVTSGLDFEAEKIDVDPPIKPLKHASGADTEVSGDHTVVASAYISYARRLNLECSKHMRVFSKLVRNFSLLLSVSFFRLNHLSFYLPEMYIKLHKILFLDDDIVLQRDLTALWKIDMDGKVNEAVEICFGSFHRYAQYMNFSHPLIKEKFELDAWRKGKCIEAES
ncbi:hypothetical protein ZIOFF_059507 [Zingiber officinale]|uniref:Hexosyltransferase n=1 Tax=Zingiber officinale TaxID=94328 RepID=A0A8J5KMQ0_ZINOF|nr:hypothetical protein ZIOFF_059507 [Zingiber officinale]